MEPTEVILVNNASSSSNLVGRMIMVCNICDYNEISKCFDNPSGWLIDVKDEWNTRKDCYLNHFKGLDDDYPYKEAFTVHYLMEMIKPDIYVADDGRQVQVISTNY